MNDCRKCSHIVLEYSKLLHEYVQTCELIQCRYKDKDKEDKGSDRFENNSK